MRLPKALASAMLCACLVTAEVTPVWAAELVPTVVQTGISSSSEDSSPAVVELNGKQLSMQLNADGRVVLLGMEQPVLLDEGAEKVGGKRFTLRQEGKHLYAVWWQKMNDASKRIYLRVSDDQGKTFGPVVKVNTGGGVLANYVLITEGDKIALAYYDERAPRFQVYLNRSLDGGKTWLEQDQRIDTTPLQAVVVKDDKKAAQGAAPFAIDPHLAIVQNKLVVTWKEKRSDGPNQNYTRLVSRASSDWTTWEAESEITRSAEFVSAEVLTSHQGQLALIGYTIEQGLSAFISKDAGKTWVSAGAIAGSHEWFAASQLQVIGDGSTIGVLFTWEKKPFKYQVHFAALDLIAGAWRGDSVRMDRKTVDATQAWRPALLALPSGQWLAAWEDYRYIRPSIFVTLSNDQGKTWSPEPFPLEPNVKQRWEGPSLELLKDKVRVYFDRWNSDARQKRDYQYVDLALKDGKLDLEGFDKPAAIDQEKRLQRLKERSNEFWNLRVQGKLEETYSYLDPAYRALFTQRQFDLHQGNVVFQSVELLEASFRENFGLTKFKIRMQIPPMMMEGREFKMDSREDLVNTEWVWMDNDWYMVMFSDNTRTQRYLKY